MSETTAEPATQADRSWPYRVTVTYTDGRVRSDHYHQSSEPAEHPKYLSEKPGVARVEITSAFAAGERVVPPAPMNPRLWASLQGRLVQDVADYREAAADYTRSGDSEGIARATAKRKAVEYVLNYMDELERQR